MKNPTPTYSPFWAITAVFLTFAFLQGVNVSNSLKQRSQLQTAQINLQKATPQALLINQTVENLGRDLLAMTNQEAQQIVADFKIGRSGQ